MCKGKEPAMGQLVVLPVCGVCGRFIPEYDDEGVRICHRCMSTILEVYAEAHGPDCECPTLLDLFHIGKAIGIDDVRV